MDLDKIKNLVAQNRTDDAFDALLKAIKGADNLPPDLYDQAVILSGRYNDIKRKERMGVIRFDDATTGQAQIKFALLDLLAEVKKSLPIEKTVFISYNHTNADAALALKEKLQAKGINVLIDLEKIQAGQDIKEFIEKSIASTDATISIVSKKSLLSSWVAMETINTFYHQKTNEKKKFIACYLEADFFNRDFTEEALATIDQQLKELEAARTARMQNGHDTRDLNNEYTRLKELSNHFDEIIRRLRESLCIDISDGKLDENLDKIAKAVLAEE